MYFTYLRRELGGRRRQTIIVATGLALAIALVIVVNALAGGVKVAQASVLSSVYGVGTDITVTQRATAPTPGTGGEGRFAFGQGAGQAGSDGTRQISQSRLTTTRGSTAFADTALASVKGVPHVANAAATLELTSVSFSGTLPDRTQGQAAGGTGGYRSGGGAGASPGTGGTGGGAGSSFSVNSFSVTGLDPSAAALGPLSAATLTSGRTLTAADDGKHVAVIDSAYATDKSLKVGSTLTLASTTFTVVGIVHSNTADSATATNVYVPLDTAQKLASMTGKITNVYVQAASSSDIAQVQQSLQKAMPAATVDTQADLASSVSGSLGTTASLVSNLGLWLSIALLVAAFALAVLFTLSGVSRRTREFGTLKAIGWSNGRITRQVAGESLAQGLIGGVVGVALGLVAALVITLVGPTLGANVSRAATGGGVQRAAGAAGGYGGGGGGFGGGGGGRFGGALAQQANNVVLHAPVSVWIVLGAVGLAVLGGLLAGAIGGWRAARLSPSEALRSVN
ncbi:ABC transporter permease [Tersicoccus sp. MR15.9]|uniref:ABC transporter permease n=1 Tax=Tersicoccus mangrovi TaxID=3121635 RepID=UPI002FE5B703